MNIPIFNWADIQTRTGANVAPVLSDSEQYILQQAISFIQQNPSIFITDYDDSNAAAIDQFLDETINHLLVNTVFNTWHQGGQLFLPQHKDVNTGTFVWTSNTLIPLGGYYSWSTPGIDNYVEWDNLILQKGIWYASINGLTNNASGIAHLIINGTTVATIDLYSAVGTNNTIKNSGNFTLSADVVPTSYMQLKMHTKNASSSNYQMFLSSLFLHRVSD